MNQFEFVIVIVAMVFVFGIIRHRLGIPTRSFGHRAAQPRDAYETFQLKQEVKDLKERIEVLERITLEEENSLAKEIESLRDK